MAFDPSTAVPINQAGGFDPASAVPVELPEMPKQPELSKKEQAIKFMRERSRNESRFTLNLMKNILAGMERGGQNIAGALTGGYAPKVDPNEVLGIKPEDQSGFGNLVQSTAQYAPLIAAGPLGLLGDIAAGSAYSATQTPESPGVGALTGGGSGLLSWALDKASVNPIARAAIRSIVGAGTGYEVGGKEGAIAGAGTGFLAPSIARRLGISSKTPGQNILEMITPGERKQTIEKAREALTLGRPLTPGEATGRSDISAAETRLGAYSPQVNAERIALDKTRKSQEAGAIKKFKDQVSTPTQNPESEIRTASQEAIGYLKEKRQGAADPFYKQSENLEIPQKDLDTLLEHPAIKNELNSVLADPIYFHELSGTRPTGAKMAAATEYQIEQMLNREKSKPYNKNNVEEIQYALDNFRKKPEDSRVQAVLNDVYKNDPVLYSAAHGINPRTVKVLDIVKKRIGRKAEELSKSQEGQDRYKGKLVGNAEKMITDAVDSNVPSYNQARKEFAKLSPDVETAENSSLNVLANLKDTQLPKASGIIFNPAQTNKTVFQYIKSHIMRQNPNTWDGIVRRQIDKLTRKGKTSGANFYKEVMDNESQFQQFDMALNHNPKAQQTLRTMKKTWEDLINYKDSSKAGAVKAKTSMDSRRDAMMSFLDAVSEQLGHKEYTEALHYLNSERWIADLENIKTTKNVKSKVYQAASMLSKIAPPAVLSSYLNSDSK